MRLRIGIGMARMGTLCHASPPLSSYIIYGNALGIEFRGRYGADGLGDAAQIPLT